MAIELDLERPIVEEFGRPRAADLAHVVVSLPVEGDVGVSAGEVEAFRQVAEGDVAVDQRGIRTPLPG